MSNLDNIVRVDITTDSRQVSQQGFGVPLLLSANASFDERVRVYEQPGDLVADGFGTSSPEYRMASAIFAQSPRPPRIALGRRTRLPTMRVTLTPVVRNGHEYAIEIDGVTYSFTSDSDAAASEIVTGLAALINADTEARVTASGTATLVLTADVAGEWFDLVAPASSFALEVDHADPGIEDDLAELLLADASWYAVLCPTPSTAEIKAIARWAESNGRLALLDTPDTGVISSGDTDVASALKASSYFRTSLWYHPRPGAFLASALAGACLPMEPGSETWAYKTLAGVPAVALTPTQEANALGKNVGIYVTIAGVNVTREGKVASGEWIDTVRGRDWLRARLQEGVFALLANARKVPFTDSGIARVETVVRGVLAEGVSVGMLSDDPAPIVSVPLASQVPKAQKAERRLPDVRWRAQFAGAIHAVDISGTLSV